MYLSCYKLDSRKSAVRKALSNAYEMHRSVMSAFESIKANQARKEMKVLYRVVTLDKSLKLYVSSIVKPVFPMPEGFYPEKNSPKDISKVLDVFEEGMIFNFDIMAIPAIKTKNLKSTNSKRVFLYDEGDRAKWLEKKASQYGFEILSFFEEHLIENKGKKGSFRSIVFRGVLKVKDKTSFTEAFKNGIGAGKAFGCGMLMLYRKL